MCPNSVPVHCSFVYHICVHVMKVCGCRDRPTAWPGSSTLLQLRLFALLFPASHARHHPTSTPLALVCGFLLSYCPPAGLRDIAAGLLVCSVLLSIGAASKRFAAEVLPFCEALLCSAGKKDSVPVEEYAPLSLCVHLCQWPGPTSACFVHPETCAALQAVVAWRACCDYKCISSMLVLWWVADETGHVL